MKSQVLAITDKLIKRTAENLPFYKKRGDSFDVIEIAFLKAALQSAEYYEQHLFTAATFDSDLDLLTAALRLVKTDGLFLEFGVASGRTITHAARQRPQQSLYGFDSFEGLPEDWRSGYLKGRFAGNLPPVPSNVTLIKGWFNETLPEFLKDHPERVAFLHVDCDLYSSTKCIFDLLADRIGSGTVIVFDEFWNYPGWHDHEIKAFDEFKARTGLSAKPIGFVRSHQQVGFVMV
ncbi:hypothetical protein ACVWZ4_000727 [Bradyrhizobium sp. USDA 4472]